jgi:hypothetical protein
MESIDVVLEIYGYLTGRQLSHMTHSESPWSQTRDGLPPTAFSSRTIELDLMAEYTAHSIQTRVLTRRGRGAPATELHLRYEARIPGARFRSSDLASIRSIMLRTSIQPAPRQENVLKRSD